MARKLSGRVPTGADLLLSQIDETGGQVRLSELRDGPPRTYPFSGSFEAAMVELVERGEVSLLPVGDVVTVKRE